MHRCLKYRYHFNRDRARFLRKLVLVEKKGGDEAILAKYAKKIFLAPKPVPLLESKFKGRFCFNFNKSNDSSCYLQLHF